MKIKVVHRHMQVGVPDFEYAPGYLFSSDAACEDYDWLVVYDEVCEDDVGTFCEKVEHLRCPRSRTILATWEPVTIKCYSKAYTRQFGHLLTNRPPEAERHPHWHLGRGYFEWFVERGPQKAATTVLPQKTKRISAICSSKRMRHTRHFARYRLVSELAKAVPGLEWFGHGVRAFDRKCDVLDPYAYHVVVENHIAPHHWTEKLSDAFLCECLPFYAGDPAIFEIFPKESIIPIPIDDPTEAARIINEAVAADEYGKRRESVLEAKRLILSKYNFWAQVIELIESATADGSAAAPRSEGTQLIRTRKSIRARNPLAALEEGFFHVRQALHLV